MEIFPLKRSLTIELSRIATECKGAKIAILTPCGTIVGNREIVIDASDTVKNTSSRWQTWLSSLFGEVIENIDTGSAVKSALDRSDGYIILNDVSVYGANELRLASVVVFFDQIVGVTIWNETRDKERGQ